MPRNGHDWRKKPAERHLADVHVMRTQRGRMYIYITTLLHAERETQRFYVKAYSFAEGMPMVEQLIHRNYPSCGITWDYIHERRAVAYGWLDAI